MSIGQKMTTIADVIRFWSKRSDTLNLHEMVLAVAELTEYDLSGVESQLSEFGLHQMLALMATMLRHESEVTETLSLDEMIDLLIDLSGVATSNGKAFYDNLADAIAECDDKGTVKLYRDIDVGDLENVSIDKNITIDGRGHKITRSYAGGNFFDIKRNVTFNLCNLSAEFNSTPMENTHSEYAFIYGYGLSNSANINVTDCNLRSKRTVIFINNSSVGLTVKNSTITGSTSSISGKENSDISALYVYKGNSKVTIESGSKIRGYHGQAIHLHDTTESCKLTISNSDLSAYETPYGVIDVRNSSPKIDLKGKTTILMGGVIKPRASIRMRGSVLCDPTITLYDNVVTYAGSEGNIYYTKHGKRADFHIRFSDNYAGSWFTSLSTRSTAENCVIRFVSSLKNAGFYALVNKNIDAVNPMDLSGKDLTIKSATIVNSETGAVKSNPCRIYYNGFDCMLNISGTTILDITNLELLADHGSVFKLNGGEATVQTKSCIIQGNPILAGFTVGEDTFITYDTATRDALVAEGHYVEEIYDQDSVPCYSVVA